MVADGAAAGAAVAWLRERGKGHAVLLRQDAQVRAPGDAPTGPGVVGPLAALVPADDPLVAALLAATLLVEDVRRPWPWRRPGAGRS
ncbi:MAG: hypothetical protein H6706_26650 [Myxococcales bacterium]|nr:hypothetical protein [Myxococcales bacterium]